MPNTKLARELIEQAAAECTAAALLADQHAAYAKRRDTVLAPKRLLLADDHAYVKGQLSVIETAQKAAEEAAKAQDYVTARAQQDEALRLIETTSAGHARAEKARTKLEQLVPRVEGLTDSEPRSRDAYIGGKLDALDNKLKAVQLTQKTTPVDLAALDKSVADIESETQTLKTQRAMRTGEGGVDAVKQQLTDLHKLPGGPQALDELVKTLPRKVAPEFLLHVLELRFNLKAKGGEATDTGSGTGKAGMRELQRLYNVMVSVPEKHTKHNPRLKKVQRQPSGGSSYAQGGTVVIGEGPENMKKQRYGLGDPNFLPDVPAENQPQNIDKTRMFDWNTQHEIAHALDDKKQFMNSRLGHADFGNWQEHGGDVLTVATAIAAELNLAGIDKVKIAQFLSDGTTPSPLPADWDKVTAWAAAVKPGQRPWYAGAACKASVSAGGFVAGGRVYHEAYDNKWISYDATARQAGITGYQFRAPGEWFSELYAAYKSDVLKDSHPAKSWLSKLFGSKVTA